MIYKSIADRLRLRLNSSDYNIGSPLPGEKALAQEFGTVKQVADPFIRPALDYNLQTVLRVLTVEIRNGIENR